MRLECYDVHEKKDINALLHILGKTLSNLDITGNHFRKITVTDSDRLYELRNSYLFSSHDMLTGKINDSLLIKSEGCFIQIFLKDLEFSIFEKESLVFNVNDFDNLILTKKEVINY